MNREANEPQFSEWSPGTGRPAAPVKAGDVRLLDRQSDPVPDEGFLFIRRGLYLSAPALLGTDPFGEQPEEGSGGAQPILLPADATRNQTA